MSDHAVVQTGEDLRWLSCPPQDASSVQLHGTGGKQTGRNPGKSVVMAFNSYSNLSRAQLTFEYLHTNS